MKESENPLHPLDGSGESLLVSIFIVCYAGRTHAFMGRLRYLAEPINFDWAAVSLSFVLSGCLISGMPWDSTRTPKRWREVLFGR